MWILHKMGGLRLILNLLLSRVLYSQTDFLNIVSIQSHMDLHSLHFTAIWLHSVPIQTLFSCSVLPVCPSAPVFRISHLLTWSFLKGSIFQTLLLSLWSSFNCWLYCSALSPQFFSGTNTTIGTSLAFSSIRTEIHMKWTQTEDSVHICTHTWP